MDASKIDIPKNDKDPNQYSTGFKVIITVDSFFSFPTSFGNEHIVFMNDQLLNSISYRKREKLAAAFNKEYPIQAI